MKYYVVNVGDGPEDECCSGPFNSFANALRGMSDNDINYYVNDRPVDWLGPYLRGWHGNITSVYIIGYDGQDKPTWEKDIRPTLIKVRSGEIQRQYDEE